MRGEDIIRKASYGSSCPLLLFTFAIFSFLRKVPEIGWLWAAGVFFLSFLFLVLFGSLENLLLFFFSEKRGRFFFFGEDFEGEGKGEEDKIKSASGKNKFCHDKTDVIADHDHPAGRK